MAKRSCSDSSVQRNIEAYIFDEICKQCEGFTLKSNVKLPLDDDCKTYICPDFFSEENHIIGEIHTHIGRLKSSQADKIAGDVLKMILFEKLSGTSYRKYIVVCDEVEMEQLKGDSFLAKAIREYNIEIVYIGLPDDLLESLKKTVKKQNVMNDSSDTL